MRTQKLRKYFGDRPIAWVPMWGISKLRHRGGEFPGSIPGNSLWYDQWYDRAMSAENADRLAGLGVNLVILPFSLGGSSELEHQEHEDFRRMAAELHRNKITALPYLQYQNLLQEEHMPPGTVWAETPDGAPISYSYWRRTACQSSEGFRNYFKGVIKAALEAGGDGIWIDNNYLKPCACAVCRRNFVEYLKLNCQDLLKSLEIEAEHVAIPPALLESDPIAQAFYSFNAARNLELHKEFKAHLESINPDALFASNPALFRGRNYFAAGVDLFPLLELNDIIYLENTLFPEKKDNMFSGNYHGFVLTNSLGLTAVSGTWKHGDYDNTARSAASRMPHAAEAEQVMLEPVVFGGSTGMFWAVREMPDSLCGNSGDKLKMHYENSAMFTTMQNTLVYINSLPITNSMENLAQTAILWHRNSLAFDFNVHQSSLLGIGELLLSNGIPFQTVDSRHLDRISQYPLVIVPDIRLMSEPEIATLKKYAEGGGKLLIIGMDCGIFDERHRQKLDSILPVFGLSRYDHFETPVRKGNVTVIPVNGQPGKMFLNLKQAANGTVLRPCWLDQPEIMIAELDNLSERQIKITAERSVSASIMSHEKGTVIQLFSYEAGPLPQTVTVIPAGITGECTLYRPGQPPCNLDGAPYIIENFIRHALLHIHS